jgi:tRNA pseudouridine38-40 synthase
VNIAVRSPALRPEREAASISKAMQYDEVKIDICGSGFLYHQIRIMVGTLLQAGIGKLDPKDVDEILAAKDRTKAGPTVPACGLMLEELKYDDIGNADRSNH